MNKKKMLFIGLLTLTVLVLAAGVAYAQTSNFDLSWWTVDGGGGHSTGGGLELTGTIGQADAGRMTGGGFELQGGFWGGADNTAAGYEVFLPVVIK